MKAESTEKYPLYYFNHDGVEQIYFSVEGMTRDGNVIKYDQLHYSFWVNDDAEITSINWPTCEKLAGEKYVVCPDGEVSARRIYDVLCEEMNTWL